MKVELELGDDGLFLFLLVFVAVRYFLAYLDDKLNRGILYFLFSFPSLLDISFKC